MGLKDLFRNPWAGFIPLVIVGFFGNPPWSYPTVPVSRIAFDLRSAHPGVSDYTGFCPSYPLPAEIVTVNETEPGEDELELFRKLFGVEACGHWRPKDCRSHFVTTLVVPYRQRPSQLKVFLKHIHQFLMRQKLDYHVVVVNQADEAPFNRGALLNVGFLESEASLGTEGRNPARCYIFHDVDLLPENLANVYACSKQPRHMSVAVNSLRYSLPYAEIVGGALAIAADQFRLVNGFPTSFAGWGGEDDDLSRRFRLADLKVERFDPDVSRYWMLPHRKAPPGAERFKIASPKEGLTTIKYRVLSVEKKPLHTMINVVLDSP